ncbi:uncharacterized protein [Spinacia oleracea]|uniref:Uncharacterized protein n=1 Tax=Spinacia oleracea TaxID=3562 RepID=A0A9R0K769_SPIOL|nr:uncharacterized protein LOC110799274 [Spinacia oleracea]
MGDQLANFSTRHCIIQKIQQQKSEDMVSKSIFGVPLICILTIALLASLTDGIRGPGEYWEKVMKGQPMPETIKAFASEGPKEVKENIGTIKAFINDFDSTAPDATIIYDGVKPEKLRARKFIVDFDSTTPDATIIYDGVNPEKLRARNFIVDFDSTTPDATIIYDDVNPEKLRARNFIVDFDSTTPDATIIYDVVNPTKVISKDVDCNTHDNGITSSKLLGDDFEPRPNISVYND